MTKRVGFDTVVENEVGMSLFGKPRWWTVRRDGAEMEIVRVDASSIWPEDTPMDPVVFIILPVGAYAFPALIGASLKVADFPDYIKGLGGNFWPADSNMGKALELRLCGWTG